MERLTRKETEKMGDYVFVNGENTCPNEIATKLGKLEDLEEANNMTTELAFKKAEAFDVLKSKIGRWHYKGDNLLVLKSMRDYVRLSQEEYEILKKAGLE